MPKELLLAAALILILILVLPGCQTTTETVFLKPNCEAPPVPALPRINAAELWDSVGQDTYNDLLQREEIIVGWALEMQAIINEVCNQGDLNHE